MSVKQSIKVTNAGLSPILSVAQGTGAIEYEFTVSDFDIPSGSAAVAYNIQPTGNIVIQTCSISGNTITIKPPAYYFLRGKNYMQFQVSRSNEDLFSFLIEVWCAPNISQPEVIVAENPSLVSQLISDVGLLSSQLDNLLSIPSGSLSTSADAALADIKVGWDGTTYDTPGDAVRGQIGELNDDLNNYQTIIMNNSDSYSNCVFSNSVDSNGNVKLQSVDTRNHRITFMSRFRVSQNRKFTILVKDGYQVRCLFFANSGDLNIGTGYKYVDSGETDLTTWHTDNRCITVPYGANGMSVCISKLDNSAILPSECKNVVVYYGGISDSEQNILLGNDGNLIGLSYSKKGIFMGDSISFGFYSYFDSNGNRCNADDLYSDYTKTAAKMRISDWFSRFYNIPIDNIAERGTGYVADSRGLGNALVKAKATDFSNYDFVALCFGVNDYIQGCNIGSIETKTEGTIIGNLIQVLEKIYNDNPYCKVIVFTPYNTWGQVRASKPSQTYYGNENTNYALGYSINGNTLQNIIDAINSVCTRYGIESVDLSKGNFCNRINIKNILVDGLHPTEKAMKALASEMYENMTFR